MAYISVKFQRTAAYICCIICVLLIYHLYHVGNDAIRSKKETLELIDMENSRRLKVKREIKGQGIRKIDTSRDDQGNVSGFKLREEVLRRETETLKSQLLAYKKLNKRLQEKIQTMEYDKNILKQKILELKNRNVYLFTEAEKVRNKSLKDQWRIPEKRPVDGTEEDNQEVSKKSPLEIPEDIPFQSFAKTHVFEAPTDPKPKEYIFRGQRKETRKIKPMKKHIIDVQDVVLRELNVNKSLQMTKEHLFEGVYRFDISTGLEYELYFKHPKLLDSIIPVRLSRRLGPPNIEILSGVNRQTKELINLILPLSGRLERFQNFIDLFINVCVKKGENVFLTLVLYGEKDFKTVKKILQNLENDYDFRKYQLIMRDKEFSRGRALHDGVVYWKGRNPNVLIFFCDVDITFRPEFLRRCRTFTEPGKQVYYPVVFSLYNPKNVYEDGIIPEPEDQLKIDRQYGFWRRYGFGMTCQYRADYLNVGGFDLSIEGWGSEDQLLHSRYIAHRGIRVIRAPDRDLFHYYHEKHCDPNLTSHQYKSCLGSKANTEGTAAQVAMQLLKLREKCEGFDEKND
ncbi:chondroitin sulfate N-acetylgalactosaminyltransferase 1-like [Actinia tenebrosa]|uniref:Hexosyltransferase n=1 Tax=Actinia tenebrosa TaxID=6105 RepID=A0A6P8IEN2_ACTTE|nr:chondroitin sulfate N-acetylgalactosaminyltransferase 1-like [Actinia tenebrosa]